MNKNIASSGIKIALIGLIFSATHVALASTTASDSVRFLWSVGGGLSTDAKSYAIHMRVSADKIVEYETMGYGLGLEYAKSNLSESRDRENYFYGFDHILGLRMILIKRISDEYTTTFVLAGGATSVSFDSSRFSTINYGPGRPEFVPPSVDRTTRGQYVSLGLHFQREHPSLVRLSEWGMDFTSYRAQFASGEYHRGRNEYSTAPGLMAIYLISLHLGIGGIIDF